MRTSKRIQINKALALMVQNYTHTRFEMGWMMLGYLLPELDKLVTEYLFSRVSYGYRLSHIYSSARELEDIIQKHRLRGSVIVEVVEDMEDIDPCAVAYGDIDRFAKYQAPKCMSMAIIEACNRFNSQKIYIETDDEILDTNIHFDAKDRPYVHEGDRSQLCDCTCGNWNFCNPTICNELPF